MITVEELISKNPNSSIEVKNALIEVWTEDVYKLKGKQPSNKELIRLADWLLEEELTDKSRSKVQKKEYPILSKPQIERRYRELSMEQDIVDVLHRKVINNQPTRKKDAKNNEY